MTVRIETRNFRGKDLTVAFVGTEGGDNCVVRADVSLIIDGCRFIGVGHCPTYKQAYEKGIWNLHDNLIRHAYGTNVEFAKNDLELARKDLAESERKLAESERKRDVARWFLDFTKDKING